MSTKKRFEFKFLIITGILIGFFLSLSSCGSGQITTGPTSTEKKSEELPPAEEEEEKEAKPSWSYNPENKKDPFKRPQVGMPTEECIKSVYLDQLWIDGIIVGQGNKNVAHILCPNGDGYFIKVGDVLGVNKGVVKEIRTDGIIVEEQFVDPIDKNKIRIVDKFLKMETEAGPQKKR